MNPDDTVHLVEGLTARRRGSTLHRFDDIAPLSVATYRVMSLRSPQGRAACPKGATQDEPLTAIRTNLTALSCRRRVPSRSRRPGTVADVYRPRRSPAFVWSSRPPTPPATGAMAKRGEVSAGISSENFSHL